MSGPIAELNSLIESAQPAALPDLIGELAAMQARAQLLMLTNARPEQQQATGRENLKAEDVALILGVKRSMIYELARSKRLKSHKVGKYVKFKESDVREFLKNGGA